MLQQKRLIMLLILLSIIVVPTNAQKSTRKTPAFPQVWYHPDSVIVNPRLCDTILMPNSYTMMIVYKSLQPDTTQQLWKLNRIDDKYYSIGTHQMSTDETTMTLHPHRKDAAPCLYTLQHTIKKDTSYHNMTQLYIGSDINQEQSRIELYEVAYFDHRLPLYQSLMFQTYLALKNGITLDKVSYISTVGDTIWNAKESNEFYNHIQGFGTNIAYNYVSTQSVSLEDSIICIASNEPLPDNNYIVIGDNNEALEWHPYENNMAMLNRIWKTNVVGSPEQPIQITINSSLLQEISDSLFLAVLDQDYNITQLILPNYVDSNLYYNYMVDVHKDLYFSLVGIFEHPSNSIHYVNKNTQINNTDIGLDDVEISPNPTDGDFLVSVHLSEEKNVTIIIQDMAGKIVSYQIMDHVRNFQYKDRLDVAGAYVISIRGNRHEIIATKELIVY